MKNISLICGLALALVTRLAVADPDPKSGAGSEETNGAAAPKDIPVMIPEATNAPVFTTNTVVIAGDKVKYMAETGMLPVLKKDGNTIASVFYVAYTRLGENDKSRRPVTFCFNGGPGSSSVWLHLGALGPRRVKMNENGTLPPPPFQMEDNKYSILSTSDLVFIDPVATGFSRAARDQKPEDFFGDNADLDSVGEFIRLWTTRHDRWLSPKFLMGESYGVFRAAGLADHLRDRYGMYLNGLILVSGVLNFQTIADDPGNDIPYPLYLPAFTAAAHFHKKLPADLQNDLDAALVESRQFARGEYAAALQQGDSLSGAERERIIAELSRLTGLKTNVIIDNHLRIDPDTFRKQLLHDEGLILGAYDSRITGRDDDPASQYPDFDPSDAAVFGPFASVMNAYVRDELKFKDDLPYEVLAGVQPWNYGAPNNYPSAAQRLAATMNQNPYMRVLVLGGRCDLVCQIDTMRYALDHMSLDANYRTNIVYAQFDAGHMMYINLPDLRKLQKVVEEFIGQFP
jgi:carboxypeptidase C (cathepsin A)